MSKWTYGVELELSDSERDTPLPGASRWDRKDWTIVNSNGVANDPKGRVWKYGGEINTEPSDTVSGQADIVTSVFRALAPAARTNYRSNLHVHVRVPGLCDDVKKIKHVARYIARHGVETFALVDPLPAKPDWADAEKQKGAMKRWRRRGHSHHEMLSERQMAALLAATTPEEAHRAHSVHAMTKDGRPNYHLVQRAGINLRALWETPAATIEFRHFSLEMDVTKIANAIEWCRRFLEAALGDHVEPAQLLWPGAVFPRQPLYDHWLEQRYQASSLKHRSEAEVRDAIEGWRKDGSLLYAG